MTIAEDDFHGLPRSHVAGVIERCDFMVWATCPFHDPQSPYVYTCGLVERGAPELVLHGATGLNGMELIAPVACQMPKAIAEEVDGIVVENLVANDYRTILRRIPERSLRNILPNSVRYYADDLSGLTWNEGEPRKVSAMQIIIAGRDNKFPWENSDDTRTTSRVCVSVNWRSLPPKVLSDDKLVIDAAKTHAYIERTQVLVAKSSRGRPAQLHETG